MSTDDQATADSIDAPLEPIESLETSLTSDTESTEETATTEEEVITDSDEQDTEYDSESLSDYALRNIDRISSMDDVEAQAAISKLEKSGREKDLEAAQVLREKFPSPESSTPGISDEVLQDAIAAKLAAMGFSPEQIEQDKASKDSEERRKAVAESLKARGLNDDPDKYVKSKEFILAFHDDKYSNLSKTERAELALSKVLRSKPPAKSPTGGAPVPGQSPRGKDLSSESWAGLSLSDLN